MIKTLQRLVLALALALQPAGPAAADFGAGNSLLGFWARGCGPSGATFLAQSSTGTAASLTDGPIALGKPCAGRVITIAISVIHDGNTNITVSAVDVDEIAFTERATINVTGGVAARISIWTGVVPNGTSGLLDYTLSAATTDSTSVGAWRVISRDDADGVPTDSGTAGNNLPITTLTIPTGGVGILACSTQEEGGNITISDGNFTERYDADQGTDGGHAGYDSVTAGTPSAICTNVTGLGEVLAGVAFGP